MHHVMTPQVEALARQWKTLDCRLCFSVTCSQPSAVMLTNSVSEIRRGQINYSYPTSPSFVQYDLQFHCDSFVENKRNA